MCASYFFSSRWTFSRSLVGTLITILLLLEALGAGIAHAANGNAQFSIEPTFFPQYQVTPRAYFIYHNRPTALIEDSIHIKNSGSARGTADLYVVDATTSQTGGTTLLPRNAPRRDVSSWITLSRQRITLNPGQSLDVPFKLHIPKQVRPGQHVGIIIAQKVDPQRVSSASGSRQVTVQINSLTGLGVLVNLPGTLVEKLKATGITYNNAGAYQSVLVGLKNTGTQMLHPSGSLWISNMTGQLLQNVPIKLDTFLPQTAIYYPVYMHRHALVPGTYEVTLTLRYEHHHLLHYKTSFIVPFPQLLKNTAISQMASDLVTPNTNFFAALTPWHYIVGIAFLFLLLSALFFWSRSMYKAAMKLSKKLKGKRAGNGNKNGSDTSQDGTHAPQPTSLLAETATTKKGEKAVHIENQVHPHSPHSKQRHS
jgi:hypothetical protein